MSIDNYDLFQKRLKTSSLIPIAKLEEEKLKTFKIALQRSYNRELIEKKDGTQFMSLISGINTQPKIEKKSFSTLVENGCDVGDVLLWVRRNSHWIVTDMEETEKSIFQGYISQALYHLKWLDNNTGKIYNEWACTKGPEETTISDGVKLNVKYDNLNQSLYLMMPKFSEGMNLLDRYFELFVNGRKWKIQSTDRYSYDKLISIQLVESLINEDIDDKENGIVDGKIPFNYSFSCSLDGVDSLKLKQELALSFSLYKNDELSTEKPVIEIFNCKYENNLLIFDSIGEAHIIISYPTLDKKYEFLITITDEEIVNEDIKINGQTAVDTMTITNYSFEHILNGESVIENGEWIFDKNYFNLIEQDNKKIKLKVRNKIGLTNLIYKISKEDGNSVEKILQIKISSIYEGS